MLLEFSVENFLSFKDEMTLNMIASSDKSLDNNLINCNDNNLIKCAVVYGPNASGKTNLLKSIGFVKSMVINSHKNQKGDAIPGLFAIGVDTGGWEAETYNVRLSGSTFSFALNSGRIAGENAVRMLAIT